MKRRKQELTKIMKIEKGRNTLNLIDVNRSSLKSAIAEYELILIELMETVIKYYDIAFKDDRVNFEKEIDEVAQHTSEINQLAESLWTELFYIQKYIGQIKHLSRE